jgi:hypothetical protein
MQTYARWLFGVAAAANFAVMAAMMLTPGVFVGVLGLDAPAGTNRVIWYLAAELIGVFGYGYVRIALDPERLRVLIHLGAVGKLAAVALVLAGAILVPHVWKFFALISGDAIFAALFLDYLRRTGDGRWT